MGLGTTLLVSKKILCSVNGHVVELWPLSSPSLSGVSDCQKVQFLAQISHVGFQARLDVVCKRQACQNTFFSNHNKHWKREANTIGLNYWLGHTSLLAMMHAELWCEKESSVMAVSSEMLLNAGA